MCTLFKFFCCMALFHDVISFKNTPPLKSRTYDDCLGVEFENYEGTKSCEWSNDDWDAIRSEYLEIDPKTDPRWDDFPIEERHFLHLDLSESVSYSVLSPFETETYLSGNTFSHKFIMEKNIAERWFSYTITKNRIYEKSKVLHEWDVLDDRYRKVNIHSRNRAYFKTHEVKYKMATSETTTGPSILRVSPRNARSYLILYTDMCKNCFFDIELSNGTLVAIDHDPLFTSDSWYFTRIDLEENVETTLTIYRGKMGIDVPGWWKIDGRIYSDTAISSGLPLGAKVAIVMISFFVTIGLCFAAIYYYRTSIEYVFVNKLENIDV